MESLVSVSVVEQQLPPLSHLIQPQPSTPPQPSSVSTLVFSQTLQPLLTLTSSYQLSLVAVFTLPPTEESLLSQPQLPQSHHLSLTLAHSVPSSVEPLELSPLTSLSLTFGQDSRDSMLMLHPLLSQLTSQSLEEQRRVHLHTEGSWA